jgi:hypothetical protein
MRKKMADTFFISGMTKLRITNAYIHDCRISNSAGRIEQYSMIRHWQEQSDEVIRNGVRVIDNGVRVIDNGVRVINNGVRVFNNEGHVVNNGVRVVNNGVRVT